MVTLLVTATAAAGPEPSCYSRLVNEWVCGAYLVDRKDQLVSAAIQHLQLTAAAVLLGLLIAVPLALLARRSRRLETAIVGTATTLYTIPSLALFPLLVPFTGITATTVVIGLALYCLTILVRAILDALRSVPPDVVESATGLGYSSRSLLMRVQLPLALPVFMAGLRVATVSTVALVTIGSIVSYGGLGNLLLLAVGNQFKAQILAASVLCVVLAVVLDLLLLGVQRLLTPWTRRAG